MSYRLSGTLLENQKNMEEFFHVLLFFNFLISIMISHHNVSVDQSSGKFWGKSPGMHDMCQDQTYCAITVSHTKF